MVLGIVVGGPFGGVTSGICGRWCEVDSVEWFVPSIPLIGWFISLNEFLQKGGLIGILFRPGLVPLLDCVHAIEDPKNAVLFSGCFGDAMQFISESFDVVEGIQDDERVVAIVAVIVIVVAIVVVAVAVIVSGHAHSPIKGRFHCRPRLLFSK